MRDLTLVLKNTRNNIVLPFKSSLILNEKDLPEQNPNVYGKFFEVEVEYLVEASVRGLGLNLFLDVDGKDFGKEPISFESKVVFKGTKTFEVESPSADEAKRKFEGMSSDNMDLSLYSGDEYLTEGFETEIENVEIKVLNVEELPE